MPAPHPLPRNPIAWYAVARSSEVAVGDVRSVEAFGRSLVLFRSPTGEIGALDAYCVHLGAHLGVGGVVDGGCLRCPFHRWGFAADGACVDIPYAKKIPKGARARAYPVRERNGVILVYHHPAGAEPDFEVPSFDEAGWSPPRWVDLCFEMHLQDIAENGVDIAHFPPIHGCTRAGIDVVDGRGMPFRYTLRTAYDGDGIGVSGKYVDVTTDWSYHGLGVFHAISTADAYGTRVRHIFHFTPVPGDKVLFRAAISADTTTVPPGLVEMVQLKNAEITRRNLEEDAPIWAAKIYQTKPVLAANDGPFGLLRRWTRRFYEGQGGAREQQTAVEIELPDDERDGSSFALPADPAPPRDEAPAMAAPAVTSAAVRAVFFVKIPGDFAPAAVPRPFVVQYVVEGDAGATYHLVVDQTSCAPHEGAHDRPDVTISIADGDWLSIHAGVLDGAEAFMTGRMRIEGDFELAVKLGEMFPLKR